MKKTLSNPKKVKKRSSIPAVANLIKQIGIHFSKQKSATIRKDYVNAVINGITVPGKTPKLFTIVKIDTLHSKGFDEYVIVIRPKIISKTLAFLNKKGIMPRDVAGEITKNIITSDFKLNPSRELKKAVQKMIEYKFNKQPWEVKENMVRLFSSSSPSKSKRGFNSSDYFLYVFYKKPQEEKSDKFDAAKWIAKNKDEIRENALKGLEKVKKDVGVVSYGKKNSTGFDSKKWIKKTKKKYENVLDESPNEWIARKLEARNTTSANAGVDKKKVDKWIETEVKQMKKKGLLNKDHVAANKWLEENAPEIMKRMKTGGCKKKTRRERNIKTFGKTLGKKRERRRYTGNKHDSLILVKYGPDTIAIRSLIGQLLFSIPPGEFVDAKTILQSYYERTGKDETAAGFLMEVPSEDAIVFFRVFAEALQRAFDVIGKKRALEELVYNLFNIRGVIEGMDEKTVSVSLGISSRIADKLQGKDQDLEIVGTELEEYTKMAGEKKPASSVVIEEMTNGNYPSRPPTLPSDQLYGMTTDGDTQGNYITETPKIQTSGQFKKEKYPTAPLLTDV
jgi:hypothetical protein